MVRCWRSGCLAQVASCRQAVSSTQRPSGRIRPGVFGQRNEVERRHHAPLGVLPAQQGLHAQHGTGLAHLGLVVHNEVLALQRNAQFFFEGHALGQDGLHLRVEKAHGVASGRLGAVHRQIGLLEQLVH